MSFPDLGGRPVTAAEVIALGNPVVAGFPPFPALPFLFLRETVPPVAPPSLDLAPPAAFACGLVATASVVLPRAGTLSPLGALARLGRLGCLGRIVRRGVRRPLVDISGGSTGIVTGVCVDNGVVDDGPRNQRSLEPQVVVEPVLCVCGARAVCADDDEQRRNGAEDERSLLPPCGRGRHG